MMRASITIALLAATAAHAASWNPCRPNEVSHSAMASSAVVCVNRLGWVAEWSCKQPDGTWQRKRWVTYWWGVPKGADTQARLDLLNWSRTSTDPADLRALVAKYSTGADINTDPDLLAVQFETLRVCMAGSDALRLLK